jgi:hypothetical protein
VDAALGVVGDADAVIYVAPVGACPLFELFVKIQ